MMVTSTRIVTSRKMAALSAMLVSFRFDGGWEDGQRLDCLGDRGRRQGDLEMSDLEIVQGLAIRRQLQPASNEPRVFELAEMEMQEGAADAELSRELADIGSPIALERRQHAEPVRVGQRRQPLQQLIAFRRHATALHLSGFSYG